MEKKRSEVADIDRSMYDFRYDDAGQEKLDGLTEDVVREISEKKDEPAWMLKMRLDSLELYRSMRCLLYTSTLPTNREV